MVKIIKSIANLFGVEIKRYHPKEHLMGFPVEFGNKEREIIRSVINDRLSMASLPRIVTYYAD